MQRLLIAYLILVLVLFATCSQISDDKLSAEHLQNDFQILRKCLEDAHPGLYWYSTKKEMDQYFDSTNALLNYSMSEMEFFKILLPVISRIRCVHTNVIPSKESVEAINHLKSFPLIFKFIDGGAFIKQDLGENRNTVLGAEVISINHIKIKDIITKLFNLLPADGFNETYKYSLLEGGLFREAYAMFIGEPDEFLIEAVDPGTKNNINFTVSALRWQQLQEKIGKENKKIVQEKINLKLIDSLHAAVLTVNTFEIKISEFNDSLLSVFKKLNQHKTQSLIIDLRKNGGGNNTNVRNMYAYIADKPFLHLKKTQMATEHFSYLKYVENPEDFKNLHQQKVADNDYDVNYRYPGTSITQPVSGDRFNGKVFILASGSTVSAASEFVILAHYNKRAIIIGEETGGGYYGATGGNYLRLVLPYSKIRVRIPTIRIYTAVDEDYSFQPKGRGVLPNIKTLVTDTSWLHTDTELTTAIKLIGKQKK